MDSKLNIQINSICYQDIQPSNNPNIRVFDLSYKLTGLSAQEPSSKTFNLLPNSTTSIFSGVRSTSVDNTTEFDIVRPDASKDIYRILWNGSGTAPAFRSDRNLGLDNTSVIAITVNGPVATYTSTSGTLMDTSSVQVGDVIQIFNGAGPSISNQGKFVIISKTATSFSVQNTAASAQTFTVLDTELFLCYSNGASGNNPQIGDKIILSSGFSSSSFGTYEIYDVTSEWIDIKSALSSGMAEETGVIPGSSGMIIYSNAKNFVLIAAQGKCVARFNGDTGNSNIIEPATTNGDPERPGVFLKQGTAYSLEIVNLTNQNINVLVASVE